MCVKRKKYENASHFINKYALEGVNKSDKSKVFINPLKQQDSFGPTESHVLNKNAQDHFIRLLDFDIHKPSVVWIDSTTIHQKAYADHLKRLLYCKEVGLDSESASAIHVFEKSRLELIQVYDA
jgi:hypothetical protein